MQAAIEDAIAVAPTAMPRRAVPIAAPPAWVAAVGLASALVVVMLFEVRAHVPSVHAKTIDPVDMAPDDLDDVKDFLKQIEQREPSDDTKAAIAEFNKLVDDIANRRLDRTEAFRRMEALEEKLLTGSQADRKALEEQLEKVGEEMKKAELTKPAGDALAEDKFDKARDALRDLAKKIREPVAAPDKAKLDQMREALKKASRQAEEHRQELDQRRQQLADEIPKMKQKMGDGGSDDERSLLEKKQRELERLDRDVDRQSGAGRQLDRLDRELEKAAEDLMKDLGLSAQDLEKSAEDLSRMEQQQMTQQEKEELRQKLQELRELVRQQGQGGKGQSVRLRRFGKMARGQGGGQGQQGQGEPVSEAGRRSGRGAG
jgi:chromosome segregation ATPase